MAIDLTDDHVLASLQRQADGAADASNAEAPQASQPKSQQAAVCKGIMVMLITCLSLGTTMWCSVIIKLVKYMSRCSQMMDLISPSPGGKPSTQNARASKTEFVEALAEKQALDPNIKVRAGTQTLKCQHCETEYERPACTVSHVYACVGH